jgi:multidrug efflux pump subunit AcrB
MSRFNLSALAVRERAVTLFLIIAIAIAGTLAYFKLGRAEDPSFTIKALTVTVAWPGATAQEMQDLVAEPLEKRLQELRWYDHVDTLAHPGIAFMKLTLKDQTPPADVPEQFYQARKKLSDEARNLPTGVLGPFVNDEYSDVTFALYALKAPGLAPRMLVRQGEHPGRTSGTDFRRVFVRTSCHARCRRARHLRCSAAAKRSDTGRIDRDQRPSGAFASRRRL